MVLICFDPNPIWAKEVRLSSVGVRGTLREGRHDNVIYRNQEALHSLVPGDTIVFEWERSRWFWQRPELETKSFRLGRLLGQGNTTQIFELPDQPGKVLRIASNWIEPIGKDEILPPRFLNFMHEGEKGLVEEGVPITRLSEYQPLLFLVAERVEGPTLLDFLTREVSSNPAEQELMARELETFALRVGAFEDIGDFRPDQVTFDIHRKQWILHDWSGPHSVARANSKDHPFRFFSQAVAYFRPESAGSPRVLRVLEKLDRLIRTHRSGSEPLRRSRLPRPAQCAVLLERAPGY